MLKHPVSSVADLAADPLQTWMLIQDEYAAGRERVGPHLCKYEPNADWERQVHRLMGVPSPCGADAEFWALWPRVIAELEEKGICPGPESFLAWNDGDAGLVRAIYCMVRHMRPKKIVETGVGHGVTSRFILEALKLNGEGALWSIDLPPMNREWRSQVGMAVGKGHEDRWTLIHGSSRRRLPKLLSDLGEIDLFIHDSLHTERNVRFEMDSAWAALGPNGALVVDDVDANHGFELFTKEFAGHPSVLGEAEPLRPDLRRFNQRGLFGVILKQPAKFAPAKAVTAYPTAKAG
ncbi:MAG: class I SAM-dependent methyltransferase [Acidobacteriaceae bacterium]